MVKNYISAKDARTQTNTTRKPLNVLFKLIRDNAEWGMSSLCFNVFDRDVNVINDMTKTLKNAGYTVQNDSNEEGKLINLLISW